MESLRSTLDDARAAADNAMETCDILPSEPVDVEVEFGGTLQELARTSRALAHGLTDEGTDPLAVIGGLQKLVTDTENLIVRYRKVDLGASETMRKKALELLYGQPDGISQLVRNITSGVYESGNGTCLPTVVSLLTRTCDLQEDVGRVVYDATRCG